MTQTVSTHLLDDLVVCKGNTVAVDLQFIQSTVLLSCVQLLVNLEILTILLWACLKLA